MNDSVDGIDESRAIYESGRAKLAAKDLVGAIAELQKSADLYPHFKTLELLGEAWLQLGKPERAVVPLAAATTLNSQVRAAMLAEALAGIGDELLAHRMALLALQRDPKNKKAEAVRVSTQAAYDRWNAM